MKSTPRPHASNEAIPHLTRKHRRTCAHDMLPYQQMDLSAVAGFVRQVEEQEVLQGESWSDRDQGPPRLAS
jgi:hypothetical protein